VGEFNSHYKVRVWAKTLASVHDGLERVAQPTTADNETVLRTRGTCGIVGLQIVLALAFWLSTAQAQIADLNPLDVASASDANGAFDVRPAPGPTDTIAAAYEIPDAPTVRIADDGSSTHPVASNSVLASHSPQFSSEHGTSSDRIHWKPLLIQTAELTVFQHAWRVAWDPGLRYLLAHKPFWHDYGVSLTDYHMDHWSDGDSFVVNDVGHPLEGAAYGRVLLQNNPRSLVRIGMHNGYWTTRLQSLAWMFLGSTQFEIGPLSETNIGNQGGYYYAIHCGAGTPPGCVDPSKYTGAGGVTNNTGWTDFIITPVAGLGWILGEDTIDRFIVAPIARGHRIFGGRVLRSALEPSRSFAALFAGKLPWMLPAPESNFVVNQHPKTANARDTNEDPLKHWELGTQYTNVSLLVLKSGCDKACRVNLSGTGFNFNYNFARVFAFDSVVNFLPSQQGTQGMVQGLFGVKPGERWKHWGLFAKVRPGFLYYNEAWPGGGATTTGSLSRFVWDFGGVTEFYTRHNGTLRVDVGTTLVRYLSDRTDTRMARLGGVISDQYYNNQGNFQVSTGYVYRF